MGKRSTFDRVERDYYRTWDPRAVAAIVPFLAPGSRFVECCAGDGVLMVDLVAEGFELVDAYDIDPQGLGVRRGDAMVEQPAGFGWSFITNPPWSRDILHPLIERLSDIAPTWLLFDAGWAYSKQARVFWPRLRKIVPVGRLKWIFRSRDDGKDDSAWYLFDRPDLTAQPHIYARAA